MNGSVEKLLLTPALAALGVALLALIVALVPAAHPAGETDLLASEAPEDPPGNAADPSVILPLTEGDVLTFKEITVTGYSSSRGQTDSTPFLTASMTKVRPGCLALSRDLLRSFTEGAPFDFGDWVVLPGVGLFIVEDTMNARWKERADIWFQNRSQAITWGYRRAFTARLPHPPEESQGLFALGPRIGERP